MKLSLLVSGIPPFFPIRVTTELIQFRYRVVYRWVGGWTGPWFWSAVTSDSEGKGAVMCGVCCKGHSPSILPGRAFAIEGEGVALYICT